MVYKLFALISSFVVSFISALGYKAVFFLMALESACLPIPSEIIMPFSGYLVFNEKFLLLQVIFWGTLGNLAGSIAAYLVGFYGGRPLIEKYGKYILISGKELDWADRWFKKYGSLSILFSRMLPVIRTFISLPAGVARMPFFKFCFYTFLGSLPWAFVLTYAGVIMGESWPTLEIYFRKFDWLMAILVVLLIGWYLINKFKEKRNV